MWNFKYKNEYLSCVRDVDVHADVQSMRLLPQHAEGVSTYDHSVLVAYSSYRVCRALGLDARAAARGGLLHDLFLYNWQERRGAGLRDHIQNHPRYALENAEARFSLTDTERDIIATHMWPATPTRFYRRWESLVVSCMDKLCAAAELLHLVPLLTRAGESAAAAPFPFPAPALSAKAG